MRRFIQIVLIALALVGSSAPAIDAADSALPPLPPLNDPATDVQIPGKFIWVDLFTSDVAAARKFYGELFGWEWRWVSQRTGNAYGMFYQDGVAIAGVAEVESPDPDETYARWVYYISVEDVDAAISGVEGRGGRTMLARHDVPKRGAFAVLADPEQTPFGVLHSSSGDTEDYKAEVGEWLWVGLYSHDAEAAAEFYSSVFGYDVFKRDHDTEVIDYVLSSNDYARAGIDQLPPDYDSHATWLGYVRVEDVASVLERAKTPGAEVLYEPEGRLEGELAILTDPFGTPLGIMRWTYEDVDEAQP